MQDDMINAILEFLKELGYNCKETCPSKTFKIENRYGTAYWIYFGNLPQIKVSCVRFIGFGVGPEFTKYFMLDDPKMFDKLKDMINDYAPNIDI